ncbi:MAG: amino acid transporter [Microbacterium sp.]
MTDKPTRRALMRPVQLLGVAFVCAAFAFFVTSLSMGAFQDHPAADIARAWTVGGIVAGVVFIAVLLITALLLLVVDPSDVGGTVDRPVLLPPEDEDPDAMS